MSTSRPTRRSLLAAPFLLALATTTRSTPAQAQYAAQLKSLMAETQAGLDRLEQRQDELRRTITSLSARVAGGETSQANRVDELRRVVGRLSQDLEAASECDRALLDRVTRLEQSDSLDLALVGDVVASRKRVLDVRDRLLAEPIASAAREFVAAPQLATLGPVVFGTELLLRRVRSAGRDRHGEVEASLRAVVAGAAYPLSEQRLEVQVVHVPKKTGTTPNAARHHTTVTTAVDGSASFEYRDPPKGFRQEFVVRFAGLTTAATEVLRPTQGTIRAE